MKIMKFSAVSKAQCGSVHGKPGRNANKAAAGFRGKGGAEKKSRHYMEPSDQLGAMFGVLRAKK